MSELFQLSAKAYEVKEDVVFLKTDVGNLVYNCKSKELNSINEDLTDYCSKNKLDILEIRAVFLDELVHENSKINLDNQFKKCLDSYCKKQNKKNKELNEEMYGTLAIGMVVSILATFLI